MDSVNWEGVAVLAAWAALALVVISLVAVYQLREA
jgi:hypothetical protein